MFRLGSTQIARSAGAR